MSENNEPSIFRQVAEVFCESPKSESELPVSSGDDHDLAPGGGYRTPDAIFLKKLEQEQELKEKLKKFGLKPIELRPEPDAQNIIMRVADQSRPNKIDITTEDGKEDGKQIFIDAWNQAFFDQNTKTFRLPPPCVPPHDWEYLQLYAEKRIFKDSNEKTDSQEIALPNYDQSGIIAIDGYIQSDWNDPKPNQKHQSLLLKELIGNESTVSISREQIDNALWQNGDSVKRIQTKKHQNIITALCLDPAQYELRLITYEEYARLSTTDLGKELNIGTKNIWTHFEYYTKRRGGGNRRGLFGGFNRLGGSPSIGSELCDNPRDDLTVRLVLSRKQS
jgi:hypothetical protein